MINSLATNVYYQRIGNHHNYTVTRLKSNDLNLILSYLFLCPWY